MFLSVKMIDSIDANMFADVFIFAAIGSRIKTIHITFAAAGTSHSMPHEMVPPHGNLSNGHMWMPRTERAPTPPVIRSLKTEGTRHPRRKDSLKTEGTHSSNSKGRDGTIEQPHPPTEDCRGHETPRSSGQESYRKTTVAPTTDGPWRRKCPHAGHFLRSGWRDNDIFRTFA